MTKLGYHVLLDNGYDGLTYVELERIDQLHAMLTGGRDARDIGYDRVKIEEIIVIEGREIPEKELHRIKEEGVLEAIPGKSSCQVPHSWMGGSACAVSQGAYSVGPAPSLDVLLASLDDGEIAHGKTASGKLIFEGQVRDGVIAPLNSGSARILHDMAQRANDCRKVSSDTQDDLGKPGSWIQVDEEEASALLHLLDGHPGSMETIRDKLKSCLANVARDRVESEGGEFSP